MTPRLLIAFLATCLLVTPRCWAEVVLIPGAASSGDQIYLEGVNWAVRLLKSQKYFGGLERALNEAGIETFVCPSKQDSDTRTIEERAEDCVQTILSRQPGHTCTKRKRSLHIMGHSMGGLVARVVAQDSRARACVASVTTVSTPNRGTPFADVALKSYHRLAKLIEFVPEKRRYLPELRVNRNGVAPEVFKAQDTPDNPSVKYYFVSTAVEQFSFHPLQISKQLLARELQARGLAGSEFGTRNDGLVPQYSMVHGERVGHLEFDHWSSACLDPIKETEGCKAAIKLLVPHFMKLSGTLKRNH